ncbi:phosphoglycolate phosphatase [Hydrogenophaga sp.]|uniref:phosphoglycolate phosphatase n=1 Tax=Hydrogenophaga sp. TaxID=1904254 RepID=UPI0025BB82E6|nr:phosphoglycolate phosphatase [Hydrogenophaga sp.]
MSVVKFQHIRAVLFDLDGTLVDSAPDLGAAADHMRAVRGLPALPFEHYRPHAGSGARGMLGVAFGMTPDHAGYEALREEFYVRYEATLTERTVVFDQVEDLLEALMQQGLRWGVVTNKARRFSVPLTVAMPLFGSAATIVSGDTTPHTKPHPAPLLEAARQLGLLPAQCLYVGDDARDILAGRSAGMLTVAAHYGYLGPGADVAGWGADAEVHSPLEVLKLLELP